MSTNARNDALHTLAHAIEHAAHVKGDAIRAGTRPKPSSWRDFRRYHRGARETTIGANLSADTGWTMNADTVWVGDIAGHADRLFGRDHLGPGEGDTPRTIATRAQHALGLDNEGAEALFYPGMLWANGRMTAHGDIRPDQMGDAVRALARGEAPWHVVDVSTINRYTENWRALIAAIITTQGTQRRFDASVLCATNDHPQTIVAMHESAGADRIGAEAVLAEIAPDTRDAIVRARVPGAPLSPDDSAAEYRTLVWRALGIAYESEEYEWLFSPKWHGADAEAKPTCARFEAFLEHGLPENRYAILDGSATLDSAPATR